MRTRRRVVRAVWSATVVVVAFGLAVGINLQPAVQGAQEEAGAPALAPLNPDFLEYLEQLQAGKPRPQAGPEGFGLGHIPPAMDWVDLPPPTGRRLQGQPPVYDLRTYGRVTSVGNQGGCGSCWAFATMASVESHLLTVGQLFDVSENNLKECHQYNWTPCEGGNRELSTGYLARRAGPMSEADDPYVDSEQFSCLDALTRQTHLREVWYIPETDVTGIKNTVMNYGAVYTCFYWNASYYDSDTYAYYYDGAPGTNHCVAIVGWNDSYSSGNFDTTPPGDGAWLLRNSWGTGWGDNGYFWMSYYDTHAADYATMYHDGRAADGFTYYEYDPLGKNDAYGYSSIAAWGANVFTTTAAGYLHEVQFYTTDVNTSYTVYVKRGGPSGTTVHTQAGSFTYPGFHTVGLTSPVSLSSGEQFTVAIQFVNSTYNYPVAIEQRITGYSDAASANAGESYASSSGASWTDITTWWPNANNAIKAVVGPMGPAGTASTFRVDSAGDVSTDQTFHSRQFQTGSADVAEWVVVSEPVEPGDVLELDLSHPGQYRKSRRPCSPYVAGVVSTEPGVVLGRLTSGEKALMALIGIVPVKACDEGGPIEPGDLLVTASRPGFVRKGNPEECAFIIGKAMEPLAEGEGLIRILLAR